MLNSPDEVRNTLPDAGKLGLLEDFCKEELAATQTYEKALTLAPLQRHSDVLGRCYASHRNRANELTDRILGLGGKAPTAPGLWGSLIPTLTSAAAAVSESLAVSLLEESEDRSVRHYRDHIHELDLANQEFLLERILPAQNTTHAAISTLKHSLV
jgi:hypothetical protein